MSIFETEIKRHDAVEVAIGLRQHWKRLPSPTAVRDKAIWFETLNFGWIMSAVDTTGHRSVLLKY